MAADITGALTREHGGRSYCLRLTLGGIAKLQGKYGNDLGGLLSGGFEEGKLPPFEVLIAIVAVALEKGERMPPSEALDVADDLVTEDRGLFTELMQAAFPAEVAAGGGKRRVLQA